VSPDGDVDVAQIRNELKKFYTVDTTEETITDILQELKRRKLIQDNTKK
jgi:hypothetical protein